MSTTNTGKKGLLLALGTGGFIAGLAISGCLQDSALVCLAGTTQCNVTCVNLSTDPANCGTCGTPCQPRAICLMSQCVCPTGLGVCGGACTDVTTDPKNCGSCGAVCATGQVCQPTLVPLTDGGADGGADAGTYLTGVCQSVCGTGVECNGSCVTLDSDPGNCGSCGHVCAQGYGCHATPLGPVPGACMPDIAVSCISSTGSVAPIQDSPIQPVAGPGIAVGSVIGALGTFSDGLLVGDNGILRELALSNLSILAPETVGIGLGPDFIEVDRRSDAGTRIYVVNGSDNTLSVLSGPPEGTMPIQLPDGGIEGLGLTVAGGYPFGPSTFPEPYARVADEIFVPLYGGFDPTTALAGGKVIRLDVSNPATPVAVGVYDLNGLNLQTFDGGVAYPRPFQALFHGGLVYVVLNNLDINYSVAGPGILAVIDPSQPLVDGGSGLPRLGSVSNTVTLDATVCLNPTAMANTDQRLLVSCSGQATFDSNFNTVAVDRSALLLLDVNDALLSSWSPQCPADAGTACIPPIAGRVAVFNGRAYVADQSSGRVFVVNINTNGQLTQLVGYSDDGGVPLQPCPAGLSNVSDVIRVP